MPPQQPIEPASIPALSTSRLRVAPAWLAALGALLLVGGCILPWMRLFEAPLTEASAGVANAGGIRQEPIWFMVSLITLLFAIIESPYRWRILASSAIAFALRLWLVYGALTAWFDLNALEYGRIRSDLIPPAPIAVIGEGWYCTFIGCILLLIAVIYHGWCKPSAS
jgi:hypothetical protein